MVSPELQFLIDIGAGLASSLAERVFARIGATIRGAPEERALRKAFARAIAEFLSCFELPEDPEARKIWAQYIQERLEPVFADERVKEAITQAVLHKGRPEELEADPFQVAWADHVAPHHEAPLPWREGCELKDAIRVFASALEREIEAHPKLHTFLIAARLKRLVDLLEQGVQVKGMETLLAAVQKLANQQERLISLFNQLARMGYGVLVEGGGTNSVIITGDNNQVQVRDEGLLTRLFRQLPDRERVLEEYRAHVRRANAYLDLRGLVLPEVNGNPLDPALVRIPLDRVYIRLRVVSKEGRPKEPPPPEDQEAMLSYLRKRYERERARWEEGNPVPPEQAVAKHSQLVILGAPGAGKSTFLRHLAWADAAEPDLLPLLVPLGRADVAMASGRSLLDAALDILVAHKAGTERELLREALAEEINAKRVRWLWDGLDEVRQHRREVVDTLTRLAAEGHRMVVTSRPIGFEPIPTCDVLYEVLPLRQEDANAFVDRWFAALAAAQGVPEAERPAWAKERARWLRAQLDDRPGLREVAESPLLLTFLAVLAGDEPRRKLPRCRKDLYALYVERLITAWEVRRHGGEEVPLLDGFTDPKEAREVALWGFRQLALHLQQAYTERPEEATRPAVKQALTQELVREMGGSNLRARGRVEGILAFWERAGLVDRYRWGGKESLAFRHLTFQEYGAARALAEEYAHDLDALWAELEQHLLDDEWEQVIPLAVAHLEDATPLLERLLAANGQDPDWQRPLFRAAAALAEGARTTEAAAREVVDSLERLARTRNWTEWAEADASDAIRTLGHLGEESYAVDRLLALARDEGVKPEMRVGTARTLGKLGRAQEAAAVLLSLARDKEVKGWARVWAAWALGKLDRGEEAATILLSLARDKGVKVGVRVQAAKALGKLDRVEELLSLARDKGVKGRVRIQAAAALGKLGRIQEAVAILLSLARKVEVNPKVCGEAAKALGRLGRLKELLSLARDEGVKGRVRVQAAAALGRLGRLKEAAAILLSLARDKEVKVGVRVQAAEALGRLGRGEEAATILLSLARDKGVKVGVRVQAAEALGRLGRLKGLLSLARDEGVKGRVRVQAAEALGRLGRSEEAATILLSLARDKGVKGRVRVQAAAALGRLGRLKEAAAILLSLARHEGVKGRVRVQAAEALGKLGRGEEAMPILLAYVNDENTGSGVRVKAARALGKLGQAQAEVFKTLRDLANDPNAPGVLRAAAKAALRRLSKNLD